MTTHGWMLVCVTLLGQPLAAHAQPAENDPSAQPEQARSQEAPAPAPSPRRARSIRKPIIDLRALARDRRPGQVMPGDPTPLSSPIPELAPLPPAAPAPSPVRVEPGPPDGPIDLPESAPIRKPILNVPANEPAATPSAAPAPQIAAQPDPAPAAITPIPVPVPVPVPAQEPVPPPPAAIDPAPVVPNVQVVPVAPAPADPVQPDPAPASAPVPVEASAPISKPENVIVAELEPALNFGPAALRVERRTGATQWRSADAGATVPWTSISPGDSATGRFEIRAGIDADAEIIVDDRVVVRLSRLGRAIIERSNERGGSSLVSVALARGTIEIAPLDPAAPRQLFARVKTPDQSFGVAGPVRVEYDAFSGTRRRAVNQ